MNPTLKAARERVAETLLAISKGYIQPDRMIADLEYLQTVLAALAEQEWQPIETAPWKDRFDVWVSSGPYRVTVCRRQRDGLIYAFTGDGRSYSVLGATHWRPLPTPPVEVKGP